MSTAGRWAAARQRNRNRGRRTEDWGCLADFGKEEKRRRLMVVRAATMVVERSKVGGWPATMAGGGEVESRARQRE